MVNRTQALVLGFFLLAMTSLLVILAAAPETYDQALRLPTRNRAVEVAFLSALLGFVTLLGFGIVGRWRWGLLAGPVRLPRRGAAGAGGCLAAHGGPGGRRPTLVCHFPRAVGRRPGRHRTGHGGGLSSRWHLGEF